MLPYDKKLKEPSRQLRNDMTDTERKLWSQIREKQLGCWFYRQKPIGGYIADFYCPKARLVIEIDGNRHFSDDAASYDTIRDEYMKSLGLAVLRFKNSEVTKNIQGVLDLILSKIPLNPPFSKGETGNVVRGKGGNVLASPFRKEPAPYMIRGRFERDFDRVSYHGR
jgi:very-short-patch-repair endonuclease